MIVFERPEALLAIPIILLLFIVLKVMIGKKLYKKIHIVEHPLIDHIEPINREFRREKAMGIIIIDVVSLLSIILLVIALASPLNQYTIVQHIETEKIGKLEIKVKPPVVIILDNSGSMGGVKIEKAKEAVLSFIEKIDNKLDIGLIVFNDIVEIAIPPTSNITKTKRIISYLEAEGGTMYTYPLNIAYQWLKPYREFNVSAYVVFASDGLPADKEQALYLIDKYSEEKIPIYSIFIGNEQEGYAFLKQMSEHTGGDAFLAKQIDELVDKFEYVAEEILSKVETNVSVTLSYDITKTVTENLAVYFGLASLCFILIATFLRFSRYYVTF
ncbi:MAG: VWA domain-containing protein [Staphylothermus sp.]|nr:VWA domain-containing protein [Staphylothermus sp.]